LWQRVFSGAKNDFDKVKPLVMPLMICFGGIVHYCKAGKTMHFVIDDDPRTSGRILQAFTRLKQFTVGRDGPLNIKFGDLTFADSQKAVPLQAADLLAYEAHRWAKKADGDRNFPMRQEYLRAMSRAKSVDDFLFFDRTRMQSLLQAMSSAEK
jgi:hypothetical protein